MNEAEAARPDAAGAGDAAVTGATDAASPDAPSPDNPTAGAAVAAADLATLAEQLGRVPRGVVEIAARCVCGRPTVVRTAPRLEDGTPFPTMYYLTHPAAVSAVSTLESQGVMYRMTERLATDEDLAAAYTRAHEQYLSRRAELGEVPEIDQVSAGGMPQRVKCLHALLAHTLAEGPGVNPIGDETLDLLAGVWSPNRCSC